MLTPRDTPTRERKSLNGLWRFSPDASGVGRAEKWWAKPLPGKSEAPVPASYNDLYPGPEVHDHVGDVWYQTLAQIPERWRGERILLRFDSATHRAVVWVDETQVAEHEGGYTPFEADITDVAEPGTQVRITVVVNNILTWTSIPPGEVDETPEGPRQQTFHDFFNYAGLHRSVWLCTIPTSYIEDVTVTTALEGARGTVRYTVATAGEGNVDVRATLRDADSAEVARTTGASGELVVDEVHPWRPGEGYLYELTIELQGGADTRLDVYSLAVGVRSVRIDGARFLINDEPFYFKGFGKHEDTPLRGKGHDDVYLVHDFALIEWMGANSFRTSHYPYAEEVIEYADRRGIVVIDEAPAVGINSGLAAGVFGAKPHTTFSEDTISSATQATHLQAIRELIARDKNHPSVVLWSIANEPESVTAESRAYFEPIAAEVRNLDPTRPVAFANVMGATPDVDKITDLFDVVMLNRYFGWYALPGDLEAAERALEEELRAWEKAYDKPILMTEYGADAMIGVHSVTPVMWTEDYQTELLRMHRRVFDRVDAVAGEQVWTFADFATAEGIMRVDGNKKGIFTRERRPKASAHVLRRLWRNDR
jgi:beta-glucuronidase